MKYEIPLVKDRKGRFVMKYFPKLSDFPEDIRGRIKGVTFDLPREVAILESEVGIPELEEKEDVKVVR